MNQTLANLESPMQEDEPLPADFGAQLHRKLMATVIVAADDVLASIHVSLDDTPFIR